jgi:hypothetical protein
MSNLGIGILPKTNLHSRSRHTALTGRQLSMLLSLKAPRMCHEEQKNSVIIVETKFTIINLSNRSDCVHPIRAANPTISIQSSFPARISNAQEQ